MSNGQSVTMNGINKKKKDNFAIFIRCTFAINISQLPCIDDHSYSIDK